MSKITNDGLTRSGTARLLYSCTHMATVGVKGLKGWVQPPRTYMHYTCTHWWTFDARDQHSVSLNSATS